MGNKKENENDTSQSELKKPENETTSDNKIQEDGEAMKIETVKDQNKIENIV